MPEDVKEPEPNEPQPDETKPVAQGDGDAGTEEAPPDIDPLAE